MSVKGISTVEVHIGGEHRHMLLWQPAILCCATFDAVID